MIKKGLFYVVDLKRGQLKETKIQVQREVDYCQLVNFLERENFEFYTYQLKSEKGLRVVIKGIDYNVPTEDIKQDLNELGFKIKYVHKVLNKNKQPQPMLKVELMPESSKAAKGKIHPIYEVRYVLNRKVTIEEPYKRRTPIQCKNCQEFGHTKTYCRLRKVCVGCGGSHTATECPKKKEGDSDKKCSNCNGNHTANYRGCPVYQAIQSNQNRQNTNNKTSQYKKPNTPSPFIPTQPSHIPPTTHTRNEPTYANILKTNGPQASSSQNDNMMQILITLTNNINQLTQTMQQMQIMLSQQTEILLNLVK